MIYVIARSVLNPGCKEKFIEAALDNIPIVREEEGCIMYELTEDFNSGLSAQAEIDENSTTFIEAWQSMEQGQCMCIMDADVRHAVRRNMPNI